MALNFQILKYIYIYFFGDVLDQFPFYQPIFLAIFFFLKIAVWLVFGGILVQFPVVFRQFQSRLAINGTDRLPFPWQHQSRRRFGPAKRPKQPSRREEFQNKSNHTANLNENQEEEAEAAAAAVEEEEQHQQQQHLKNKKNKKRKKKRERISS